MSRSIATEITQIAGCVDLTEALDRLGLAPTTGPAAFTVEQEWRRGGSETYVAVCRVDQGSSTIRVVLKACVAFSLSGSLNDIFSSWLTRRRLLAANGVVTPRLFGVGEALLIEEFLDEGPSDVSPSLQLIDSLASYAATLIRLGFAPVDAFSDLRVSGDHIVPIDFGEDLGPADSIGVNDSSRDAIVRQCVAAAVRWWPSLAPAVLRTAVERALSRDRDDLQ